MRKIFVFLGAMLCAVGMMAQSYGILVNDTCYYPAAYMGADPYGGGYEQYLSHVPVDSGDVVQLYDALNKAAWAVDLDNASVAGFTRDGNKYDVVTNGCFDFYIKLKWEADRLYIGPGSDCGECVDPNAYTGSVPVQCTDVMFQAFYWDSYNDNGYGVNSWKAMVQGNNYTNAEEIGKWFDLVWLPPMSKSTGGTGYLPICYSNLSSRWGNRENLETYIRVLHLNGAKVVADVVINHIAGSSGWCTFAPMNFGAYGTFNPVPAWICQTDEMNYDTGAGDCIGKATGANDDGYGLEANYEAGRDWDHQNEEVRKMFRAYLTWLRNDVPVEGFRYDYCKGFHNSHINDYNTASEAYFSVMEYWDGDVNALRSHIQDAGMNTCTFDFATKYTAFNDGIAANNYSKLKGAGLLGAGLSRYAVTFLDSHDSFQRDNNEFCGKGNSMKYPGKIQQCYAYLLSMPGIPCVFYPHWAKFKDKIKPMINARYKTGVHSESAVSDEAGDGYYKATVTGKNGEIRVLIGPNSGYNTTPSGYTLAVKGENYGVYYKMTVARGDKDKERIPLAIEEVTESQPVVKGQKFMKDGQLYIRLGEQVYDMMGRLVK